MAAFTTSWIGRSLENGRFLVGEKLGEGGMAIVFKASDLIDKTDVVIKVPKQNVLEDETSIKRFANENRALITLRHPHILSILHVGEWEGWPFAVLQYLPGGDLEDCRREFGGKLSLLNVSKWLPAIADALDFIHAKGYVHRDVKPANILFDGQGRVFLSDFGVAKVFSEQASKVTKLTSTGMVLGTPEYMAPELIMGHAIDGRVDQYALAMTVYECLAGDLPFRNTTPVAVLFMQATEKMTPIEAINPGIPQSVSQTLARALAKNPDERFPSCRAFAEQLLLAIRQSGLADVSAMRGTRQPTGTSPPFEPREQTQQSVWKDKRLWIASGVAASITAAFILMVILRSSRSQESPQRAADASPSRPRTAALETESRTPQTETAPLAKPGPTALLVAPFDSETARERQEAWAKALKTEGIVRTNSIGMTLALIPPGEFPMGSPAEERNRYEDEIQRKVWITEPFFLGTHEVTQGEFERVMDRNPSHWDRTQAGQETSRFPVERVTWFDCLEFCNKLSVLDGLKPYYTLTNIEREEGAIEDIFSAKVGFAGGNGYRLPTEAQWEYACRAGTTTATHFGDSLSSMQANFNGRDYPYNGATNGPFLERPTHGGSYPPNAFGLYDMHGNLWEWCWDEFDQGSPRNSPVNNPTGIVSASSRVQRGGGWNFGGRHCRSATSRAWVPLGRGQNVGFRVALVPDR